MYLHVGNNRNIREKQILGIFDADSATISSVTRKYLAQAEKEGAVEAANEELPKSFVVYFDAKGNKRICFSQLSSAALGGRMEKGQHYDK